MATGDGKYAVCQPDLVSLLKVTLPRSTPFVDQRLPMWVPVLADAL
jgi:hypothetical protein